MNKPQWEIELSTMINNYFDENRIIDFIRSEKEKSVEETKRKCIEALIQFAEPYEGAKWLNVLSPDDIKNIINNV